MRHKILWFTTTVYLIILLPFSYGQAAADFLPSTPSESPAVTAASAVSPEETAARQLRIYREALLQGTSDIIRIDAAVALLLQNDAASRDILISALRNEENSAARLAVCSALVKSRGLGQTIYGRQDYLEPLLAILKGKSPDQAKVAAEALLLFDYASVEPALREIIANSELGRQIRVQAIDALQLRPEPQALRIMISLLDDGDPEVAKAAETSLQESFGIPIGTSRSVWADILVELQQKSPEDIRRERLLRQETRLREVSAERDRWQKLFLAAMDRQYETSDEAARLKMIQDAMVSDLAPWRVWTLDKIAKFPVAAERLKTPLLALLSDPSREVRLQTAKVLTNMSALNPAEKLLERFKLEKDPELALAMFEALGEACFFAYSPGSGIELPIEIKMQTLEIAIEYLNNEAPDRVKKGAEVIRKLLELNNLPDSSARVYLSQLYQRYEKSKDQPVLKADLLAVLAHLCGQGGLRPMACVMYEPLFIDAVADTTNPALRLSGARGIAFVDKSRALELFRSLGLNKDESLAVQQVVIETTGQAGSVEDLDWLITGMLNNIQGEQAWVAVKSICQRQSSAFLVDWINALETAPGVTTDEIREILEIAEMKAEGENLEPVLTQIRQRLIAIFCQRKSWEQAAAYLLKFNYSDDSFDFSETTNIEIMRIYLYTNQSEKAFKFLQTELSRSDVNQDSPWLSAMKDYFIDEDISADNKKTVLQKAEMIRIQDRPQWLAFLEELRRSVNLASADQMTKTDITSILFAG